MESQGGDGWKKWAEIERKRERAKERERQSKRIYASSLPFPRDIRSSINGRDSSTLSSPFILLPSSSSLDCTLGLEPTLAFSHRERERERERENNVERERERDAHAGTKGVVGWKRRKRVRGRRALSAFCQRPSSPRGLTPGLSRRY